MGLPVRSASSRQADQIRAIKADIARLTESALAQDIKTLRTTTSKSSAPALLALMPELGTVTGKQVAAHPCAASSSSPTKLRDARKPKTPEPSPPRSLTTSPSLIHP